MQQKTWIIGGEEPHFRAMDTIPLGDLFTILGGLFCTAAAILVLLAIRSFLKEGEG